MVFCFAHADAQLLHLGSATLRLDALKELVEGSAAGVGPPHRRRGGRSGALTRVTGVGPGAIRSRSEVLTTAARASTGRVRALLGDDADEVRRTLLELNTGQPGAPALVVFYSAHADAQLLHLGSATLRLYALRELVEGLAAGVGPPHRRRRGRSGALTRVTGVGPGAIRSRSEVLTTAAHVSTGRVRALLGDDADEVPRTLLELNTGQPGAPALVVFYSAHADAQLLHLGSATLRLDELKELVEGSAAGLRILIVDAVAARPRSPASRAWARRPRSRSEVHDRGARLER